MYFKYVTFLTKIWHVLIASIKANGHLVLFLQKRNQTFHTDNLAPKQLKNCLYHHLAEQGFAEAADKRSCVTLAYAIVAVRQGAIEYAITGTVLWSRKGIESFHHFNCFSVCRHQSNESGQDLVSVDHRTLRSLNFRSSFPLNFFSGQQEQNFKCSRSVFCSCTVDTRNIWMPRLWQKVHLYESTETPHDNTLG